MIETCLLPRVRAILSDALDDPQTGPLLRGIYEFDPVLYKHSVRSAIYALDLGLRVQALTSDEQKYLVQGMLFHDLGKLIWPRSIYYKRGPISGCERGYIKWHPVVGAFWLARDTGLSDPVLRIVMEHHERVDGSGYPLSKRGHQIYPPALLCGLVEVYDALLSDRPYRKSFSPSEAISIIMDQDHGFPQSLLEHFREWSSDRPEVWFVNRKLQPLPLPVGIATRKRGAADRARDQFKSVSKSALLLTMQINRGR